MPRFSPVPCALGVLTKRTSLSPSIGAMPAVPLVRNEHRASKRVRNENGGQKKRQGKKGEKRIAKARVKGKSASPVRRSHYRLGFDCSGSAGTGATRYTLYSASVRFLEIHSVEEGVHTDAHVYTCTHVRAYTICNTVIHPRVSFLLSTPARNERRRKKKKRARRGMSVDL